MKLLLLLLRRQLQLERRLLRWHVELLLRWQLELEARPLGRSDLPMDDWCG